MSQPERMNSTASQSSSSGWLGGSPCAPKSSTVFTRPVPKSICQSRLTATRAVSGFAADDQPPRQRKPVRYGRFLAAGKAAAARPARPRPGWSYWPRPSTWVTPTDRPSLPSPSSWEFSSTNRIQLTTSWPPLQIERPDRIRRPLVAMKHRSIFRRLRRAIWTRRVSAGSRRSTRSSPGSRFLPFARAADKSPGHDGAGKLGSQVPPPAPARSGSLVRNDWFSSSSTDRKRLKLRRPR